MLISAVLNAKLPKQTLSSASIFTPALPLFPHRALSRGQVADLVHRRSELRHHAPLLEDIHVGGLQGLRRVSQQVALVDVILPDVARRIRATSSTIHEHRLVMLGLGYILLNCAMAQIAGLHGLVSGAFVPACRFVLWAAHSLL